MRTALHDKHCGISAGKCKVASAFSARAQRVAVIGALRQWRAIAACLRSARPDRAALRTTQRRLADAFRSVRCALAAT